MLNKTGNQVYMGYKKFPLSEAALQILFTELLPQTAVPHTKPRTKNNTAGIALQVKPHHALRVKYSPAGSSFSPCTLIARYEQALSAVYAIVYPFSPRYCFPSQRSVLPSSVSHSLLLPKAPSHYATCYTKQACSCCLAV